MGSARIIKRDGSRLNTLTTVYGCWVNLSLWNPDNEFFAECKKLSHTQMTQEWNWYMGFSDERGMMGL